MNPIKAERAVATSERLSAKAAQFTESVIREMTRLALQYSAVNLSQGFPDFAAPAEIKRAAQEAIAADINQYAITWGAKSLRNAIAEKFERTGGFAIDPGARNHGLLRLHRSDDVVDDGYHQSWR